MNHQEHFSALRVEELEPGRFTRRIVTRSTAELPAGEILIRVRYSSLNYKDALSASGNRGITRHYPHTPGIDAAGEVAASTHPHLEVGAPVLVTGFDLGMNTSGGFGQYVRVPAAWVLPLPAGLTLRQSMILGTAGFTAGLSVARLLAHPISPGSGSVLVTGASGGVGSLAVAILAHLGFRVSAASGKPEAEPFLRRLSASDVLGRHEVLDSSDKPLLTSRWAAVVDTLGGDILSCAIKSTMPHGAITCCGNVASPHLRTTVYPFILRGITLYGIDSAQCPMPQRQHVWRQLAGDWKPPRLEETAIEIGLDELDTHIDRILAGRQTGRVLINLDR
jgi:putative YhdH/YhfP family quinone oxidoreductase